MIDFISPELLVKGSREFGVNLSDEAVERFNIFAKFLCEQNEHINLTRIVEPEKIVTRHFIDSLALCAAVPFYDGMKVCDIGTGAGFPGIPLLIAHPGIHLTMIDSTNKKLDFVRAALRELGLDANVITVRAEDFGQNEKVREKYDLVTSRAVAQLSVLVEYSLPLCRMGGKFAPLKAVLSDEERTNGIRAANFLGSCLLGDYKFEIPEPDGEVLKREIILFQKTAHTSAEYPRNGSKIAKRPL